ncbi:MAG: tetratricopeptide repeat protein [Phycisphaerae bacterium]|jgi:tetratricopeptide (TPR) repeat protein
MPGPKRTSSDSSATARPPRGFAWLGGAFLVIVTVAAYSNGLWGEFVLDDTGSITDNATIRRCWPVHELLAARQEPGSTTQGRPLLVLSLAANYAISGLDVFSYHVFNVAMHVLAALALFGLLNRLLRTPGMPPRLRQSAGWLALATAMIWAVHPLTTAAVTYVIQRVESMMALLYLLTLYCMLRGSASRRAAWWYVASVAACAAGMATKEPMASVPLAVLLLDRAFIAGSFRKALSARWGLYLALAATWGLLVALAFVSGDRGGTAGAAAANPLVYAATEAGVVLHYLSLSFWPHPLCLDYDWKLARSAGEVVPGAIVICTLLGATLWALVRRPRWGFAGAVFFMVLAPTSSFIPLADLAFEHRMYLPLAALVSVVVVGASLLMGLLASGRVPGAMVAVGMALGAVGIVTALLVGTRQRNEDYRSAIVIWRQTLTLRPDNQRAHNCLGLHLEQAGRLDEAMGEYDIAARLDPNDWEIFMYRGNLLKKLGRFDQAAHDYSRVIELRPKLAGAYMARAGCCFRLGQRDPKQYDRAWADLIQCRKLGLEPPRENVQALESVSTAPAEWNP